MRKRLRKKLMGRARCWPVKVDGEWCRVYATRKPRRKGKSAEMLAELVRAARQLAAEMTDELEKGESDGESEEGA